MDILPLKRFAFINSQFNSIYRTKTLLPHLTIYCQVTDYCICQDLPGPLQTTRLLVDNYSTSKWYRQLIVSIRSIPHTGVFVVDIVVQRELRFTTHGHNAAWPAGASKMNDGQLSSTGSIIRTHTGENEQLTHTLRVFSFREHLVQQLLKLNPL